MFVCPSAAFINQQDYEIQGPKDNADFPRYLKDISTKYPQLKIAYNDLYKCWVHYHGKPQG